MRMTRRGKGHGTERRVGRRARRMPGARAIVACAVIAMLSAPGAVWPPIATALVATPSAGSGVERSSSAGRAAGSSLETAAAKAGQTGRAVAMSLIGLAFAVAATVLAFRRDFKEAAGVFAVGIVSVLLATSAGVSLLRDTVSSIFGG
jgi:hypothetical protein